MEELVVQEFLFSLASCAGIFVRAVHMHVFIAIRVA